MRAAGDSVSCRSCGTSITSSARFCENCGAPQDASAPNDPADDETLVQPRKANASAVPVDLSKQPQDQGVGRLWARNPAPSAPADPAPAPVPPPAMPKQAASTPSPALATAPARAGDWQTSLPAPFNAVPLELLAVGALMTIAGLLTLYPAIRILPDMVELLGQSGFARQIGLLLLTVWAILALVGVALIFLAWKMVHGDRVARGLSYVLLGGLGGAILIGDEQTTELVLGMLACFGALAVLALAPSLREFFGGAPVVGDEQPAAVVQARMLVAIWAATMIFVGVMFLALDDLDGKFLPIGVLLIVLGAATWYVNGPGEGRPRGPHAHQRRRGRIPHPPAHTRREPPWPDPAAGPRGGRRRAPLGRRGSAAALQRDGAAIARRAQNRTLKRAPPSDER
jgi:hypothetical protein